MFNLNDQNSISVFTDASIFKVNSDTYIGAPGFATVYNHQIINSGVNIIYGATNNYSEIAAIHMGILELLRYNGKFKTLNLFSDSKISILGMRDWIFKWIDTTNHAGTIFNSSGMVVANQDIFLNTMKLIISNGLQVNLYHQRGHINYEKQSEVFRAMKDFDISNNFEISYDQAVEICRYNDFVDNNTRDTLHKIVGAMLYNQSIYDMLVYPFTYVPKKNEVEEYKKLINKGGTRNDNISSSSKSNAS